MVEHVSWEQLSDTNLGPYHIQKLLDQHLWGPFFLADDSSGQTYTLRFIGLPQQADPAILPAEQRLVYLGRFQQTANQLAALHHPRILPLLDYGSYLETPYLVYPYQKLPSLRGLLKAPASLDLLTVGRFLEQLAEALTYAHARGVLHGNLSTLCISVRSDRRLVVSEFGLMHLRDLYKQYFPPTTGSLFDGSSEASAPEQWLSKPVAATADLYALGAVLYRLLTKHAPFEANSREEVMQMHLSARPAALSIWRADLPAGLDVLLAKALAKEPLERFQRPEDLALAYWQLVAPNEAARMQAAVAIQARSLPVQTDAISSGAPQSVSALSSRHPTTTRGRARVSRRRLITLLAAGGLGAAALFAVLDSGLLNRSTSNGSSAAPVSKKSGQNAAVVLAHVAAVPLNSAKTFPISGQENPGILIHLPDNRFVAFDSTCPHAGCAVSYTPSDHQLLCPCHSASFDPANNAAVTHGPAKSPLTPVKISVNADGTITI